MKVVGQPSTAVKKNYTYILFYKPGCFKIILLFTEDHKSPVFDSISMTARPVINLTDTDSLSQVCRCGPITSRELQ